jgi:uncharacterized membrane protein
LEDEHTMGRKTRAKKTRQAAGISDAPLRSSPNWALLAISVVGMVLTGYLTFTAWSGGSVRGCTPGSGCDVVLTSRWATMFGLPTAFWGFLAYAGLAAIAFIKRSDTHWRYAWTAALLGVAYSVYLTTVSLTVLDSACPYCLTSLGLMIAVLAVTTYQRPAGLTNFSWQRWLIRRIPVAAAFVFALHLQYAADPPPPEDPRARALADHLTAIGAKFYGAYWCEHCQEQKKYFGQSAERLPYVECSPGGSRAPMTKECRDIYIKTFPTWVIKDRRVEGVLSLKELSESSGFKPPTTGTP